MTTLSRRTILRKLRLAGRSVLGNLGRAIPHSAKLWLARRSSVSGMLLAQDGPFVLEGYLDNMRLEVNALSSGDRAVIAGKYEPDTFQIIEKHVKTGDVCVDVGANTGAISLALCRKVGSQGRVFCFEPGPTFFNQLQRNIALNPQLKDSAILVAQGVSDKEGILYWNEDAEFPGNAVLSAKKGISVPVTTLDSFLDGKTSRFDFIKVDVEGMELEVLRGADQILARFSPTILFESIMEFEVFRRRPVRKEIEEFLTSRGYRLFSVGPSGETQPVRYPHFTQNTLAMKV